MSNDYFTTKELADIIKVGKSTVQRWLAENRIPCSTRTIGGAYRFSAEDVTAIKAMLDNSSKEKKD